MLTILPTGHTVPAGTDREKFGIRRASTVAPDEQAAVVELRAQLHEYPDVVFCFVSPSYDLEKLGPLLQEAFPTGQVVGSTTSGQIGRGGYEPRGISACSLSGTSSSVQFLLSPLDALTEGFDEFTRHIRTHLTAIHRGAHAFGFLLCDGLSRMEERLIAAIYAGAGQLPIVGGSAGDDLAFEKTLILHGGRFHENAAVLSVIESPVPIATLTVTHHVPTEHRMAITRADPEQRLVYEINGRPAAEVYAAMVGMPIDTLGPGVFSRHPLMLQINDGHYIRSIQQVEKGGAIRFACAIEKGLILRLAEPAGIMDSLRTAFDAVADQIGHPDVILGCDCVLRRLELEALGMDKDVGEFLASRHVVGFSTYGEQLEGVHVNQTFVGIALRGER